MRLFAAIELLALETAKPRENKRL